MDNKWTPLRCMVQHSRSVDRWCMCCGLAVNQSESEDQWVMSGLTLAGNRTVCDDLVRSFFMRVERLCNHYRFKGQHKLERSV